jgi:hypothetical protein
MARSIADVLSAQGLRRKVPASRLGTVGASNSAGFEWKEQSRTNPQVSQFRKPACQLHDCALNTVGTNAVAEPGVVDFFSDLPKHDCRDAGGRATQEQLPRDVLEEATRTYLRRVWEVVHHPRPSPAASFSTKSFVKPKDSMKSVGMFFKSSAFGLISDL